MENQEKIELPKDEFAAISYALFDYKRLLEDAVTKYPQDKDLSEVLENFKQSLKAFQTVLGKDINPLVNTNKEILITVLENLEGEYQLSIFAGLSAYIDILNETIAEEETENEDFLEFYDLLTETFNYVAAIFSNLKDSDYDFRKFITDMIADGLARRSEHKVIYDSFQEILAGVKIADEASSDFATKFYEALNPLEKEFFASDFLPDFVEHTESVLGSETEISDEQAMNFENSLVAAKQMYRLIQIAGKK